MSNRYDIIKGQTTLGDLFQAVSWSMVETILQDYYSANQSTIDKHKQVYNRALVLEAVASPMLLSVTENEKGGETYVDVTGKDGTKNRDMPDFKYMGIPDNDPRADALVSFALEFRPWQEWLGMAVCEETLKKFPPDQIVAHCLWEMTFIDYDEKKIQGEHDRLESIVEEIKSGKIQGKEYSSAKEMIEDIKRSINAEETSQEADQDQER